MACPVVLAQVRIADRTSATGRAVSASRSSTTSTPHHGDPFDRLLVAQAQVERLVLVTGDAALSAYDVEIVWG